MRLRAVTAEIPAIRLVGVSKHYGGPTALDRTDLEIAEGEFFCLLGPSGCGKTTTLNLIGGFVNPSSGEIYIRDRRVDRLPPYRRSVNTVFQSYALFPHMTVRANVGFGLKMARVPAAESRARVEEALRLVGLEEFGERLPGLLSGGQQQRVAVARALVNGPAVLLLGEPRGGRDREAGGRARRAVLAERLARGWPRHADGTARIDSRRRSAGCAGGVPARAGRADVVPGESDAHCRELRCGRRPAHGRGIRPRPQPRPSAHTGQGGS